MAQRSSKPMKLRATFYRGLEGDFDVKIYTTTDVISRYTIVNYQTMMRPVRQWTVQSMLID
jgi:hypothetical protein